MMDCVLYPVEPLALRVTLAGGVLVLSIGANECTPWREPDVPALFEKISSIKMTSILEAILSLGKQAKILTRGQTDAVLGFLSKSRYPTRNRAIFLLSLKAGLRAKEIALLSWEMITDADGQVGQAIHLQDKASKGRSGRIIPMNGELRSALQDLRDHPGSKAGKHIISSERSSRVSPQTIVNMFSRWYEQLGFAGCSSHSGQRTFITNTARKISTVGGSIRDIQALAGHTNLRTTQRYIEMDADAQRKVVGLI